MFTGDEEKTQPINEYQICLDDLHYLIDLLGDHYDSMPNTYDKELANQLLGLWLYYKRKTRNTANYYLSIKR